MHYLLPIGQSVPSRVGKAFCRVRDKTDQSVKRLSTLVRCCLFWQKRNTVSRAALSQSAIAYYLRLPTSESRQHLLANGRFLAPVEARRKQHQSSWRLQRHRQKWYAPDLDAYRELLIQDPRSRIVATYHFGDFAFGLNCLLREDPAERECIVLTQQTSDAAYFKNMQRAFGDRATTVEQQWPIADLRATKLAARLRKQVVTLVTFCDLPPTFGATTEVQFLDRSARFPRGAAALAMRYNLPILPIVCYHNAGRHRIAIASQIEPHPELDETRTECVSRLTQQLSNKLQEYVRWAPQQWRFLGSLPAYFAAPEARPTHQIRTGAALESR